MEAKKIMDSLIRKYGPWVIGAWFLICALTYFSGENMSVSPSVGGFLLWIIVFSTDIAKVVFWPLMLILLVGGTFALTRKGA